MLEITRIVQSNQGDFFTVGKQVLVDLVSLAQERSFAEEVDFLQEKGGINYLQSGLQTDFNEGLKQGDDLNYREVFYGHNRPRQVVMKSFCALFVQSLEDFTLRILLVASIVSVIIEVSTATPSHRETAWVEGFAIFVAVMVCALVTAGNDYQKERQFQELNKLATDRKTLTVSRGGTTVSLHSSLILVGDVVQVFEGMEIPADCLVLESSELTTDESVMTGESDPVKKSVFEVCIAHRDKVVADGHQNTSSRHEVPSPILLSGTTVLTGMGRMLVLVVGENSCVGRIRALIDQDDNEATPLQMKLEAIAHDIGKFGLVSAIIIVFVLLLRFTIERSLANEFSSKHVGELLGFFIIGITVVVVAIPEGLPLSVTLSLAYSTKRMLKDNNLVRRIAACETMGGASMICSDKTGTLTQNKMTLVRCWTEQSCEVDAYSGSLNIRNYISAQTEDYFMQAAIANGTAMLRPEVKGSSTEVALLHFIEKCGYNYETIRKQYRVARSIPFSSQRKRMSLILTLEGGQQRIVLKGASEMLLQSSTHFMKQDKTIVPIDEQLRQYLEAAIENLATSALRTIGLAYKELTGFEDFLEKDNLGVYQVESSGLIFFGILGIKDILRQEVPTAVAQCRKAGIKVRMVTGDNKVTARAIAAECGITDDESLVMEGPEFMKEIGGVVCKGCGTWVCDCPRDVETAKRLNKSVRTDTIKNGQRFEEIYPHLDVLARSRPEDKYALVTGLIERGHVVAVTGDGTNDAPALKKADVGFAMGKSGTEVAREAAAIILLDDNFNSILLAVMWGRNIYDSIRKFLQFQLTVNVVAVALTLIGALVIKQEVLKPIQMLWINLIMDTFASLALATETPNAELLERKPHDRNEYIVSKKMAKHILGQGVYQFMVILVLLFAGDKFLPEYKGHEDTSSSYIDQGISYLEYKYKDALMTPEGGVCPDYTNYCTMMASGRFLAPEGHEEYLKFYNLKHIPSRHVIQLCRLVYDDLQYVCHDAAFQLSQCAQNLRRVQYIGSDLEQWILPRNYALDSRQLDTYRWIWIHRFFLLSLSRIDEISMVIQTFYARMICVGIGFGSLPWSVLIKLIPDRNIEMGKASRDPLKGSGVLELKRKGTDRIAQFRSQHSKLSEPDAAQRQYQRRITPQKLEYIPIKVEEQCRNQDLSYNSFEVR